MIYVALLRGINVGGNNKVDMKELAQSFVDLGFTKVQTYINSGNVIFEDNSMFAAKIVTMIEQAIEKDFGLEIRVLVRNLAQIERVCTFVPLTWTNDATIKTDVLFLWNEVDKATITDEILINKAVDNLMYVPGSLIWNIDRSNYNQSMIDKFITTRFYRMMTARNINTVRKLLEMMQA